MAKKVTAQLPPDQMREHIDRLNAILAKGSVGDFWSKVEIPEQEDQFTELYVGIELMFEVIREKYAELEGLKQIPGHRRELWGQPPVPARVLARKPGRQTITG